MSSPFASPAPNSHNNFTPAKAGVSSLIGAGNAALKPPKPPEKPLVPYMRFSRKMWHKVRDQNPESQLWDIGRKIGALWREMTSEEKRVYQEEYEVEKVEYDRAMKAYHNSAPFQAYLASKNKAKMMEQQAVQQAAAQERQAQQQSASREHHRQQQQQRVESGVFIQAVDEDDGESQVSIRRIASARYERNHRLISDLFSDSVVQDTRNITTQQRINMLKRQASSLATHQKNLENELVTLEEKFEFKKKLIEESSQAFGDRLKKVCDEKPVIDELKYQGMVKQATSRLLQAFDNYKQKHEAALKRAAEAAKVAVSNGTDSDPAAQQAPGTGNHPSVTTGPSQIELQQQLAAAATETTSSFQSVNAPLVNGVSAEEKDCEKAKRHLPVTEQISSTISEDSKDQMNETEKGGTEYEEEEMSESTENQLLEDDEDD